MLDISELGWDSRALGELDHRLVKAPYLRLASYAVGVNGDTVYSFDVRITQPNTAYLSALAMHSVEHLLLAGFRHYLPHNFICVAPMGCQTGFYLVLLNEGRMQTVVSAYEHILMDVLDAKAVPYASPRECGHSEYHDLDLAKSVARNVLGHRSKWLQTL